MVPCNIKTFQKIFFVFFPLDAADIFKFVFRIFFFLEKKKKKGKSLSHDRCNDS